MTDTIPQAWGKMVANIPVAPGDIGPLVNQVLDELSEVASPAGGTLSQSDYVKPYKLEHGFTIFYVQEAQIPGGFTRAWANIQGPGRPPLMIGVQVRPLDNQLGVTAHGDAPEKGSDFTYWQPENGPQKQWVLQNLRQRLAEYISPGQQSQHSSD